MARLAALAVLLTWALVACTPRLLAPGPHAEAPVAPALDADALSTADGLRLPVRSWLPPDGTQVQAAVVALHGFNDYSNAFAKPADWLAARGFAVYAYDQRGFGATPGAGKWAGAAAMADDLRAMLGLVRARHPGIPTHALGLSMGGAVVLAALGPDAEAGGGLDADSVVLVGPAVWGRATMPAYQSLALWLAAHSVPWLKLTARGLDVTPSDNVEMLRALSRDPLVIKETRVDAIWGLVGLMDLALEATAHLDRPALVLYGSRDEVIPTAAARAMLARLPPTGDGRPRIAVYDAGYHMLLRDLQAEIVWRDIAAWLEDPAARLPSGADARDPLAALAGRD